MLEVNKGNIETVMANSGIELTRAGKVLHRIFYNIPCLREFIANIHDYIRMHNPPEEGMPGKETSSVGGQQYFH